MISLRSSVSSRPSGAMVVARGPRRECVQDNPRRMWRNARTRRVPPLVTRASQEQEEKAESEEEFAAGFKFDGALQRWVRDDKVNYYSTKAKTLGGDEYTVWPVIHTYLTEKGLQSLPAEEVLEKADKGEVMLLDIRVGDDYEKGHIRGAKSAPMFRRIPPESERTFDKIKRITMLGLAMTPTERNPDFLEAAKEALVSEDQPVVVYCSMGGTLDTKIRGIKTERYPDGFADTDRAFGRESRSLKACYELMRAGYKNVYHLDKGLSSWRYEGLPMEP